MKGRGRLAALVLLSLAGAGIGLTAWPAPPPQAPVWPSPPGPARVRFVTSIGSPRDIGATGSWLARAAGVLVGRKRQPSVLRPRGLATDASGRLLVADPDQRMVHVLDIAGRKYSYLEPAPFLSPVGVAVGPDQNIYVSDSAKRRVYRYTPDGRLRAALGVVNGEAVFARPTGLAVTPGGDLLVVDSMNARIQLFESDGGYLGEFGKRGNGTGDFDKPKGVALDSDGHVYVAEAMHDVVQVFDTEGRLLLVIGRSGKESGEFSLPSAVHIDASNRIFVADALNGRVQVFQYVSQPGNSVVQVPGQRDDEQR